MHLKFRFRIFLKGKSFLLRSPSKKKIKIHLAPNKNNFKITGKPASYKGRASGGGKDLFDGS